MAPGVPYGLRALGLRALPFLLLLLALRWAQIGAVTVTNYSPWGECTAPPKTLQEKTGATVQSVFSLCLRTKSGLEVTFDNANSFFIGNATKYSDFGTTCYTIEKVLTLNEFDGEVFFTEGGNLDPAFVEQSWDLSLWPKPTAGVQQVVNLTVSNFGPSDLSLTGIDYAKLGLPTNFQFATGGTTTIAVDYSKVELKFDTLQYLQEYMLNDRGLQKGTTGLVILKYPTGTNQGTVTITYAIVKYDPGNPIDEWSFFLYESTYFSGVSTTSGGRRLLLVKPTNKAPATACSKGCCKPVKPLPKTCKPSAGAKIYPACIKTCGCFCK